MRSCCKVVEHEYVHRLYSLAAKSGNAALARMGFAQCAKKSLAGHTTSAEAHTYEKFAPLDADKVAARRAWLEKKK